MIKQFNTRDVIKMEGDLMRAISQKVEGVSQGALEVKKYSQAGGGLMLLGLALIIAGGISYFGFGLEYGRWIVVGGLLWVLGGVVSKHYSFMLLGALHKKHFPEDPLHREA